MELNISKDRADKFQLIGFLKSLKSSNDTSIKSYSEMDKNSGYEEGYYKGFADKAKSQNKLIDSILKGMED